MGIERLVKVGMELTCSCPSILQHAQTSNPALLLVLVERSWNLSPCTQVLVLLQDRAVGIGL